MRSALVLAVFAVVAGRGGCAPDPTWDPCEGRGACEPCTLCEPGAADCFETAVVKVCDAEGRCVPDGGTCTPYDPCAGKKCGETCDPCVPGEPCPMYFAATACDAAGECMTVGTFTCEPPPDPCAGKGCGEPCSTCDPALGACPAVMMYCDAAGACGYAYPACTTAAP